MSQSPNLEPARRLTDDEAHAVLARAAELDAHIPATVSIDELWSSATAAGISRDAFERATAELRAGKLVRADDRIAISAALLRTSQIVLAIILIIAAFRTPDYSGWWIAQSVGAACAVYGAYTMVGFATSWFGGLRDRVRASSEPAPHDVKDRASRSDTSMAERLLGLRQMPRITV